jgi:hypothetical protein
MSGNQDSASLTPCSLHDLTTTEDPDIQRKLKIGTFFSLDYFFFVWQ